MDIASIAVGLIIGLILGLVGAGVFFKIKLKSQQHSNIDKESEIKALVMQHASEHLQTTRSGINAIENELEILRRSINHFEHTMQEGTQETETSPFFGEHASLFLRHAQPSSKQKIEQSPNQPTDFASSGASGLFTGNGDDVNDDKRKNEENISN